MKVLLINKNELAGGSAQVCQELLRGLRKNGLTVSLFCASKNSTDQQTIQIKNHPLKKILAYLTSNDLDYYYGDEILETAAYQEADLIHLHNISGHFFRLTTLLKICKQKPVVWTLHDMQPLNHYFAHSFAVAALDGLFTGSSPRRLSNLIWYRRHYLKARKIAIYQASDFSLVSPSAWLAAKVKLTALATKPLTLIHNGIDPARFFPGDRASAKRKIGAPEQQKIILTVTAGGRNNILKGGQFITQLASHFPETLFISLGNDHRKEEKNIRFEPMINNLEELRTYYQAADLLLFPSLAENFPLASLEAMACGTPVVAFKVGGLAEQIDHEVDGYLAQPQVTADLIKGIDFIYSRNASEISKQCRQKILTKFNAELMIEKYLNLYYHSIQDYENRY